MTQDKRSAGEQQKHISMDLTADGARVTNLSLQGNRLVLTIEAELADSRLRTNDSRDKATAVVPAPASVFETRIVEAKPEPAAPAVPRPAEFVNRPQSADAPALGFADPHGAASEAFGMGSESLPPAPPSAADRMSAPLSAPQEEISGFDAPDTPDTDVFREDFDVIRHSDPHDRRGHEERELQREFAAIRDEPASGDSFAEPDAPDSGADATLPAPTNEFASYAQDDFIPASPIAEADAESDVPALSGDSSAVGGERHGEPLPAFSFGSAPATAPAPAFESAPAPKQPAPPRPAPPRPEPQPAQEPAPIAQPFQPLDPAPQPERPQARIPEDAPTQLAMRPVVPEPPEPPKPEPDSAKPESGGTTVLIRYTCPKCKTQGMQAVDKVGAVVNCANCGKAMRLVMKK